MKICYCIAVVPNIICCLKFLKESIFSFQELAFLTDKLLISKIFCFVYIFVYFFL